METNVSMLLEKIKVVAEQTRTATVRVADKTGKKVNEMAQATRLNLQVFDLNTECEVLYKEIGKTIYDIHQGAEVEDGTVEEKLARLAEITGTKTTGTAREKSGAFIAAIRAMNERMGIPEHLDVIREEDIPQMVAWALREANPTYPVPVLYDEAHCAEVIRRVGGK